MRALRIAGVIVFGLFLVGLVNQLVRESSASPFEQVVNRAVVGRVLMVEESPAAYLAHYERALVDVGAQSIERMHDEMRDLACDLREAGYNDRNLRLVAFIDVIYPDGRQASEAGMAITITPGELRGMRCNGTDDLQQVSDSYSVSVPDA